MNRMNDTLIALYVALETFAERRRADQRGVVSIEYLVLGAALIVVLGALAKYSGLSDKLGGAIGNLFDKAGNVAG